MSQMYLQTLSKYLIHVLS